MNLTELNLRIDTGNQPQCQSHLFRSQVAIFSVCGLQNRQALLIDIFSDAKRCGYQSGAATKRKPVARRLKPYETL